MASRLYQVERSDRSLIHSERITPSWLTPPDQDAFWTSVRAYIFEMGARRCELLSDRVRKDHYRRKFEGEMNLRRLLVQMAEAA